MAGQDQSANLGGMLSQIGNRLGSGGAEMGNAFGQMIINSNAPKVDPNDPTSLQRAAEYAQRTGDTATANMYMQEYRRVVADQKAEAERQKAELTAKAANAATFQYKTALESGNAEDIAKAEEALLANATAHGYDGMARLSAASTAVRAQQDQQWQADDRARQEKERAAEVQFTTAMNGATDPEAIQKIVDTAPAEMRPTAQRAATARLQYLDGVSRREEQDAVKSTAVSTEIAIPEALPEELKTSFDAEIKQLEKEMKAAMPDGQWATATARSGFQQRRDQIARKISDAHTSLILGQERDQRNAEAQFDKAWRNVSTDLPTKTEMEEIRKTMQQEKADAANKAEFGETDRKWWRNESDAGDFDVTDKEVIAEFRNRQYDSLELTRPTNGDVDTSKRVTDTDTDTNEVKEVASVAEAEALPVGTRFKLPDGRTGTVQ